MLGAMGDICWNILKHFFHRVLVLQKHPQNSSCTTCYTLYMLNPFRKAQAQPP